jgi:hypothetical protein
MFNPSTASDKVSDEGRGQLRVLVLAGQLRQSRRPPQPRDITIAAVSIARSKDRGLRTRMGWLRGTRRKAATSTSTITSHPPEQVKSGKGEYSYGVETSEVEQPDQRVHSPGRQIYHY